MPVSSASKPSTSAQQPASGGLFPVGKITPAPVSASTSALASTCVLAPQKNAIPPIPQILAPLVTNLLKLPFPVSLTNHEDHYLFINPAFERVYGYTLADLQDRDPRVLTPRGTFVGENFLEKLNKDTRQGGWSGRLVNATRKGKRFHIGLRTLMLAPDGASDGITQNPQNSGTLPLSPNILLLGIACEAGAEETRDRALIAQFQTDVPIFSELISKITSENKSKTCCH